MKIPPSGTKRYTAMRLFYKHGAMRASELALYMPNEKYSAVQSAIKAIKTDAVIENNGLLYDLTKSARKHLDDCEVEEKYIGQIAPPREKNVYTAPPLSSKYQINAAGMREGSNDYKQWPSVFGSRA